MKCEFCGLEDSKLLIIHKNINTGELVTGCAICWDVRILYNILKKFPDFKGMECGDKVWVDFENTELSIKERAKGRIYKVKVISTPKGNINIYICRVEVSTLNAPYKVVKDCRVMENSIFYRNPASEDIIGEVGTNYEFIELNPILFNHNFTNIT